MLIDHQKVRSSECGGSCVVGPSQSPSGDNQKIHNNRAPTFWWSEHLTIWESITLVQLFSSSRWYLIAAPIVPESMVAKNRSEVWRRVLGRGSDIWRMKKGFRDFPTTGSENRSSFLPSPFSLTLCNNNFGTNSSTPGPSFRRRNLGRNQIAAEIMSPLQLLMSPFWQNWLRRVCTMNIRMNTRQSGKLKLKAQLLHISHFFCRKYLQSWIFGEMLAT